MAETVALYIDYRSPYSYLAKDEAYQLEQDFNITLEWFPFYTDLTGAYGGGVEQRPPRERVKVKYLYMDCRRLAQRKGLTIRGTVKIYDPTLVSIAMLWTQRHRVFRKFHDAVLPPFWNREFDIEDVSVVTRAVENAGAPLAGFDDFLANEGKEKFAAIQKAGEARGVFGVPSFIFRDEVFWGTDRIGMLREVLQQAGLRRT
jgi:2-hydroxychromene-2-carboxylate isomerase